MNQPALIPGMSGTGLQPVRTGKVGRGATAIRSSSDSGAPRFVAPFANLTGDREMTFNFRPLKYWPDNGDQGLAIAFHFFKQLGCFTVADNRILHGIYKCLDKYTAQELCEAIDAKCRSLGETFNDRRAKITYVAQPQNFFDPDAPQLKKWLAKSPTWLKRQSDESRRAALQRQSEPDAQARVQSRGDADFTRAQQEAQQRRTNQQAAQERNRALVQRVLEQLSDIERKAFEAFVQDEHSAAEFKRIAARRFETILPADELARRVAAHVRAKGIVTIDAAGNATRGTGLQPVRNGEHPPPVASPVVSASSRSPEAAS